MPMPSSTQRRNFQTNAVKAHRQYIYRHCQLCYVTPSCAVVVGVCILMLPMLELATEHVQLTTTCHMNLHHVHPCPVIFSRTHLLPFPNNVLPAMVLQNREAWSNIKCPSSHSRVDHVSLSPAYTGLGRRVVGVVIILLLLMSGDIEMNPGPLGQEDLKSLHCELHPVCDKWFSLGVQLRVPIDTLRCIRRENLPMTERLLEMLTVWLRCTNPPPTWNILTDALESPPLGERLLAQQLRDKYCSQSEGEVTQGCRLSPPVALPTCNLTSTSDSQPETAVTLPTPVSEQIVSTQQPSVVHTQELPTPPEPSSITGDCIPPDTPSSPSDTVLSKQSLKQRVKQLESRFLHLVYYTYMELLDKGINVEHFYGWLVTLDVSRQREHQEFIESFQKGTDLSDLWKKLCSYWNFLNFDLLEHVVMGFGSEDLKKKMESYESDLQCFRKATRVCDFIACWPVRGQTPPESELREFVAKVDYHWDCCTLEDLDILEGVITRKFFLPKFVLRLREIKPGSITITWLIPVSFVKTLQETIESTNSEFFMEHKIESIAIAGQECYPSLKTNKHSGYLQELSSSTPRVCITPPTPLHSVKPHASDEETITLADLTPWLPAHLVDTKRTSASSYPGYYSGSSTSSSTGYSSRSSSSVYSDGSSSTGYSSRSSSSVYSSRSPSSVYSDGSSSSGYSSRSSSSVYSDGSSSSGYSSRSSTTGYSSRSSSSVYSDGSSSSGYSSRSSSSVYSSGSSSTGYSGGSSRGAQWYNELEPTPFLQLSTPAERYATEKCVDKISEHVKLLPSLEQYMSKTESEADPSLLTKYKDYLSSTPPIRAALYTTFNAKMAAEVFTWSQHTEAPPPTTMTELFTAFTLKTLVDHLSTHPVYHKQQLKVTTFSDLPTDVYKQFQDLCRMAYEGILNRQQLVFSVTHLPTGFASLGLMQEVPQLYTKGRPSSYHFIHLTLQEYLSAIHISQLPVHEQTKLFQEHVNSGHFKMTMRFLAGLTKLANIPPDITVDTKLNYFHFLFEAKEISMTTRTLGADEMDVGSHYSWTPLDYYVTGHAISHSNCPWRLNFWNSSIDDEKFELFCQGCADPGGTGCRGHISYAPFWYNDLTTKSIQSFVNIPPHIIQYMRELNLHHNELDGSACDLLAKTVPLMTMLEELWLGRNPIGRGGTVKVIKALCGSGVKLLWLYNTGIGEPDCEALCELLKSSHSLQHLHIYQNNLSSESVASIITGLSHNSSLTKLNISYSHFSMANVDSLASVLKDHSKCTLKELDLEKCHISSEGAVELVAALCKNTTLEHLDLRQNPIGEHVEGVTAVAKMLVENKTLTWLDLEDCHISSKGAVELAAALCKNSTLKHVKLNFNPIGVEGASSMSDMLQHNTSLEVLWLCEKPGVYLCEQLWLDDVSVGEEGVHQLINSLKHNQTLKLLVLPEQYQSETSDHRIRWL